MGFEIWLEYVWICLIIIGLESILSADNALVMGVLVKDLPEKKRKKALFYGIIGAYVFRFIAIFLISYIAGIWQLQALGAAYLIYLGVKQLVQKKKQKDGEEDESNTINGNESLWKVILKVELTDITFAIDSILAAVAIAVSLPKSPLPGFGGLDGGIFLVVFIGMAVGLAFIRVAATYVVDFMKKYPGLEIAAFIVVSWVGVKLGVHTLASPDIQFGLITESFVHNIWWKIIFWGVFVAIILGGWFFSSKRRSANKSTNAVEH